jgi:ankyrin repeat protein
MKAEQIALSEAIVAGEPHELSAALAAGADVNFAPSAADESPLDEAIMYAPEDCRLELVRLLVEHGANVNFPGDEGCRPLFHAVLGWQDVIFAYLLSHGADPNFQMGDDPETLFDWAITSYQIDFFDFKMPEPPAAGEDVVGWLARLALKYDKPQPSILKMLKAVGAKRFAEMKAGPGTGN